MLARKKKAPKMVLIGVFANRNWILGNWLRECKSRAPRSFKIRWVPTIYGNKRFLERFFSFPIPKAEGYFFSYITIFEHYLIKDRKRFLEKSIVLYPHNEPEMGDIQHQVSILNQAYKVYFFCNKDLKNLVLHGLKYEKTFLAYCAIDIDCIRDINITQDKKTILVASKFGPRKGAEKLLELINYLDDWSLIIMGRGWEELLKSNRISNKPNVKYVEFNKANRVKYMSRASVFLSLSNLEGGPVPLIEAMSLNLIPICTDTGFAEDFIQTGVNGFIIPINPTVQNVKECLSEIVNISQSPSIAVEFLTWDRITKYTLQDLADISILRK
jgi:glycosyltransferase involved in cell wall biosynthesis